MRVEKYEERDSEIGKEIIILLDILVLHVIFLVHPRSVSNRRSLLPASTG